MDKTIMITLNGQPGPYQLEVEAYDTLARYLDRAAAGLADDPDRADVLGDLERSVADKLAALLASGPRVVSVTDIDGILDEIGAVETGREPTSAAPATARRRRLERITERQQVAGVCAGLAEYAHLNVDWVRLGFLVATTVTAGVFALVYGALAFIMPVAEATDPQQARPGTTGPSPR
jgi:phage shock protein PspC (stress-responsive transcriptional regulator)